MAIDRKQADRGSPRKCIIIFRVSDRERATIERAARKAGISLAAFIRTRIMDKRGIEIRAKKARKLAQERGEKVAQVA